MLAVLYAEPEGRNYRIEYQGKNQQWSSCTKRQEYQTNNNHQWSCTSQKAPEFNWDWWLGIHNKHSFSPTTTVSHIKKPVKYVDNSNKSSFSQEGQIEYVDNSKKSSFSQVSQKEYVNNSNKYSFSHVSQIQYVGNTNIYIHLIR